MDEELEGFARQYALRRNITLGDRLGFGIHGTVFAAVDNKDEAVSGNGRAGIGSERRFDAAGADGAPANPRFKSAEEPDQNKDRCEQT
jgi:hypothetical protein